MEEVYLAGGEKCTANFIVAKSTITGSVSLLQIFQRLPSLPAIVLPLLAPESSDGIAPCAAV